VKPVRPLAAITCAWACATPALAHPIAGLNQSAPGWTWDPWITVPLALSALLFAIGWLRLRARSSGGRAGLDRRALLFATGWLLLAGAVVSPLHQAGETSFAFHMLEHELMMLAAAPLLVLSRPLATMLGAFPAGGRQGLGADARSPLVQAPWRAFSGPLVSTLLQAAALWLWHLPSLFDLALAYPGWHAAQHLSFLVTALFFWSAMLTGPRGRGRLGLAAVCLFFTSVVSGALGAFMALSGSPWYANYAALGMTPYGLTPAEDQQLAGLLMWVPGGFVHAGAALALIGGALGWGGAPGREAAV
jgi:cytochrome c oxidase assembly factor CtaG